MTLTDVVLRAARPALAALTILTAVAGGARAAASGCPAPLFAYHTGIVAFSDGGHGTAVRVEVADTPEKQEVGLMCRPQLAADAGMLFVFPTPTEVAFWMKNTLIPLSIAFIDGDWHIVGIMEMPVAPDPNSEDPRTFALYGPQKPYRYALEVNAGFFAAHGITTHAVVRFIPREGRLPPALPDPRPSSVIPSPSTGSDP